MRLLLTLSLCSVVLHAATWYVAVNGNDANPGTQALPFATIDKANQAMAPGDVALVGDGTYQYNGPTNTCCGFMVNVNKANLTFKAINRRQVIVDVNLKLYSAFQCQAQCSGLTIQGFIIKNGYWSGFASNSGNGKNLLIKDNHFGPICTRVENSQTGCTGIFTDGAATGAVDGNEFSQIGRTNDAGNTFDHGLYYRGNLTVTNNIFTPYNGWGIQTALGAAGLISNNAFMGPVQFDGKLGQIMLWDADGAITIANNVSTGSRGTFLTSFQFSSPDCRVYNNASSTPIGAPAICNTTPPPAQSVTVTVNGQAIKATLPLTIGVQ